MGVVLFVLLAACVVAGVVVVHRVKPMLRARLTESLSQCFGSPVQIGNMDVEYRGGLEVAGRDLQVQSVLRGVAGDAAHPMLRVQEFHFRMGLLSALGSTPELQDVSVRGVFVDLPHVAGQADAGPEPRAEFAMSRIVLDDAHMRFGSADAARAPFVFDLPHVELTGLNRTEPFHFDVVVDNGAPVGLVRSRGEIGPWNRADLRETPVSGSFGFENKDMSGIRGMHGMLSVKAKYSGVVSRMETEGTTEDPSFGLDVSSRPVALRTSFRFGMDAAEGLVRMETIDANFLRTHFVCSGVVTKSLSPEGYNLNFALKVPEGRVEDALALGAKTFPPILRGALTMGGRMLVPAGPVAVARKLQLNQVHFHVRDGVFSNPEVRGRVNAMSERASGNPKAANEQRAAEAMTQVDGELALQRGTMQFKDVHVSMPGAQVALAGRYSLDGATFAFDGTVHTDATVSKMTTGIKSLLARPFNGMFAHGATGATMPLRIRGAGTIPRFDLMLPGGARVEAPAEHH